MREGTCEFCELDSAGNHESNCLMNRAGRIGVEVPDYLFIKSEPWPDFPETDSLLKELDYRELYKDAERGRSFWFALAKELAAVLVTETWEEWGDEHGELLSLPLSPVSPAAILAYYQEGVKREGVDE